jgi:hypothetical protein
VSSPDWGTPGAARCASSTLGYPGVSFSVPGASRVRAIKRSRRFALAYLRQLLAVALKEEEFRIFRKGTRLSRVPQRKCSPGLSWYMISGNRVNLLFARWCVTHYQRTLGLDPRNPDWVIKLPTLDFLRNYSSSSAGYNILQGTGASQTPPSMPPKGDQVKPGNDEVKLHHGGTGSSGVTSLELSESQYVTDLPQPVRAQLEREYSYRTFGPIAFGY